MSKNVQTSQCSQARHTTKIHCKCFPYRETGKIPDNPLQNKIRIIRKKLGTLLRYIKNHINRISTNQLRCKIFIPKEIPDEIAQKMITDHQSSGSLFKKHCRFDGQPFKQIGAPMGLLIIIYNQEFIHAIFGNKSNRKRNFETEDVWLRYVDDSSKHLNTQHQIIQFTIEK